MSVKLLVRNLPQNLTQGAFMTPFSELRGFLNSSLLMSPQNELYGILDFANYELADYARQNRSNFKFPGSHHPINIDFYKPQDVYEFPSGQGPINPGLNIMSNPQPGVNVQGQPGQPIFMQPRFPGDNPQSNEMFNMMNQLSNTMQAQPTNFPFPANPTQFVPQQAMGMGSKPIMQPTINSNLARLDPNINESLRNFSQMPSLNNAMSSFSQMLGQMSFNANPSPHGPQGNPNMNFFPTQNPGNRPPVSNEDVVMFKVTSKATSSIYVDGVPIDASEREVAHIFRPYPGFKEVRLIKKEAKSGRKFYFCFVDFENALQATIALCTLQGYRFDKNDKKGFRITYAFHTQGSSRGNQNKNIKLKRRI